MLLSPEWTVAWLVARLLRPTAGDEALLLLEVAGGETDAAVGPLTVFNGPLFFDRPLVAVATAATAAAAATGPLVFSLVDRALAEVTEGDDSLCLLRLAPLDDADDELATILIALKSKKRKGGGTARGRTGGRGRTGCCAHTKKRRRIFEERKDTRTRTPPVTVAVCGEVADRRDLVPGRT